MSLESFLAAVLSTGRIRVPPPPERADSEQRPTDLAPSSRSNRMSGRNREQAEETAAERRAARQRLIEYEQNFRETLAGEPPPFDADLAMAAADWLYRGCQCLVYRHLDAEAVAELLADPLLRQEEPPTGHDGKASASPEDSASAHYSVDCGCGALPDLVRLARVASENDPLVEQLLRFATRWPLSSIGVRDLEVSVPPAVREHTALWQLYVDRVMARQDHSRMQDEAVREAVASSVGLHTALAGELSLQPAATGEPEKSSDPPSTDLAGGSAGSTAIG